MWYEHVAKPAPAVPLAAARLSMTAVITYQIVAAGVIFVRPDLDPSWQPPSEWAIGRSGWIMVLAFLVSAVSHAAALVVLRSQVRGASGQIGLGLLLICAIGTVGVGVFVADPIMVPFDALSTIGTLHVLFGTTALLLLPFAALLINLSLLRRNPAWAGARRVLSLTAGLPLLAFVSFGVAMAIIEPADHHAGPDVPIGWPSRLVLLA